MLNKTGRVIVLTKCNISLFYESQSMYLYNKHKTTTGIFSGCES